jgi:hypothetical protein
MQRSGSTPKVILFVFLGVPSVVLGQGSTSAPAATAAPSGPMPTQAAGPPSHSGGIKLSVTSIAAKTRNVALSLSLENISKENLFLAVIGPPVGINGGVAFSPEAIGGVAYCIYNPRNVSLLGLDRADQISGCLKAEKPQLTPDTFTLIEAGNAVPMNVAFGSSPVDREKDFSFSMNVAVFKESDLDPPGDSIASGAKTKPLPKSLRYLSLGIAPLPLK